jgi:TetR/AcrR family transcriptional regulator, lmrAB and yxaGH operons repressor
MADDPKQRMISSALQLLASRGLQAASFSEVLDRSGAPRGSVYHHFPNGKDQLVAAALELAGGRAVAFMEAQAGASARDVTSIFLQQWRDALTRSQFEAGCSVLAVAVATDSAALRTQTADIFRTWRALLARLLHQGGLAERDATAFAATLIAGAEGAVVLARAEHSLEPFELVVAQLLEQVERLAMAAKPKKPKKPAPQRRPR